MNENMTKVKTIYKRNYKFLVVFVILTLILIKTSNSFETRHNKQRKHRFKEEEFPVSIYYLHPSLLEEEINVEEKVKTMPLPPREYQEDHNTLSFVVAIKSKKSEKENQGDGINPIRNYYSETTTYTKGSQLEIMNMTSKTTGTTPEIVDETKKEQDPDFRLISSYLSLYITDKNEMNKALTYCCDEHDSQLGNTNKIPGGTCNKSIIIKSHLLKDLWKGILFQQPMESENNDNNVNTTLTTPKNTGCITCPNVQFETWVPITEDRLQLPYQCYYSKDQQQQQQQQHGNNNNIMIKVNTTQLLQIWINNNEEDSFTRSLEQSLIFSITFENSDGTEFTEMKTMQNNDTSVQNKRREFNGSVIVNMDAMLHIEYDIDSPVEIEEKNIPFEIIQLEELLFFKIILLFTWYQELYFYFVSFLVFLFTSSYSVS